MQQHMASNAYLQLNKKRALDKNSNTRFLAFKVSTNY